MKAYRFFAFAFVVVTLAVVALSGCSNKPSGGGGCTSNCGVSAPTIGSFTASPTSIVSGSSTTLSWTTTGATSVSIDNGVGSVTPVASGSVSVKPAATTTYMLTATNSGGSATAQATVTVAQPVSVSVSCSPANVPQGQMSQCTATVQNATNGSVTWSASAGTISSAGVLSVPIATSVGTVITVTATSVADTTKSGTAQVAILPRQIVLSWFSAAATDNLLSPETIVNMQLNHIVGGTLPASGIQAGDVVTTTDPTGTTSTYAITANDVANGDFNFVYIFNCGNCIPANTSVKSAYAPHFIKVQVVSADGIVKSNTLWVPLTTDQQTMVLSNDGSMVYFAPGAPYAVQEYSTADGSLKGTVMGENNLSVATDDTTGDFLTNESTATGAGTITYITSTVSNSANTNTLSYQASTSNVLMAVAAKGGIGYATDTAAGKIDQVDLATMAVNYAQPAGIGTWALDTATVNNAPMVASYSVQDTTIRLHDKNLNLISSLALSDATIGSTATHNLSGGWPIRLFKSGTVVLLDVYDQTLYEATLDSSQTLHLANTVSFAGNVIGVAKDETHQAVVAWSANTATGTTAITSYDLATMTATGIASANSLPVGFEASAIVVSPDGTKLYVGGINFSGQPAFYILNNQ